jgi:hypothetical protein
LHPARAGWEQGIVVAVLDEPPVDVVAVVDRTFDQSVTEADREGEVVVLAAALPDVEHDVADARGPAAAPVVVPEAGAEALGDSGDLQ